MSKRERYNKMYNAEPKPVCEVEEAPVIPEPVSTMIGMVVGCGKLNVREQPSVTANIVCVMPVSSEIEVYADYVNGDWYRVCTASGIEGFCMKQYIELY